ncbi:DgyrCDS2838 [Dimorphilus gyrociliatus]|uniref:DgyrCDS2838 n=1 Tax=Dimorphilus gyrociliatus TaxID=2664684 RepID=A0A7I8VBL7_9ANNE|nr:DgyrCDS2838 [Dimorphilus gyrociliatus]
MEASLVQALHQLESDDIEVVSNTKGLVINALKTSKFSILIKDPGWLVYSLIEIYVTEKGAENCMEVLAKIEEPNDKLFFEKLNEFLKNQQYRYRALLLLGCIVTKQPLWLGKIVRCNTFKAILQILKTDASNVPVLLTAALDLCIILPSVAAPVANHLQEIFDVFIKFANFVHALPGNNAKAYASHAQITLFSLFNTLYGMFPCHFLAYLRNTYPRTSDKGVFKNVIDPLLKHIKLHPLLITSSLDEELSKERLGKREVQDIVAECSQLTVELPSTCHIRREEEQIPNNPNLDRYGVRKLKEELKFERKKSSSPSLVDSAASSLQTDEQTPLERSIGLPSTSTCQDLEIVAEKLQFVAKQSIDQELTNSPFPLSSNDLDEEETPDCVPTVMKREQYEEAEDVKELMLTLNRIRFDSIPSASSSYTKDIMNNGQMAKLQKCNSCPSIPPLEEEKPNQELEETPTNVKDACVQTSNFIENWEMSLKYPFVLPSSNENNIHNSTPLPDLLKEHLQLGSEVSSRKFGNVPLPGQSNVSWTHFGGVAPADEVRTT